MKNFEQHIAEARTMREIFRAVNMFYDTDKPLPYLAAVVVKANVKKIITDLKLDRRIFVGKP